LLHEMFWSAVTDLQQFSQACWLLQYIRQRIYTNRFGSKIMTLYPFPTVFSDSSSRNIFTSIPACNRVYRRDNKELFMCDYSWGWFSIGILPTENDNQVNMSFFAVWCKHDLVRCCVHLIHTNL
jgi:hypothetical protein